jgi:hypothetical protein
MSRYRTWILRDGPLDENTSNNLAELGYDTEQPSNGYCSLFVSAPQNGYPQIEFATRRDLESFSNRVIGLDSNVIDVFCCAPAEELRRVDGMRFQIGLKQFTFAMPKGEDVEKYGPYSGRILRIRTDRAPAMSFALSERNVRTKSPNPPAFIEPQALEIDDTHLLGLCSEEGLALNRMSVGLLPPVRLELDETYFGEKHCQMRLAMWRIVVRRLQEAKAPAPTLVDLWRLCDVARYREFLLDGGTLEISSEDDHETKIVLRIAESPLGDSNDPERVLAWWRFPIGRKTVNRQRLPGPAWMQAVTVCLKDELEFGLGTSRVVLSSGKPASEWRFSGEDVSRDPTFVEDAFWKRLQALGDDPEMSGEPRSTLFRCVLAPSGPRPGQPANDGTTERLFLYHVWRCPWPDPTGAAAWRDATVDFVRAVDMKTPETESLLKNEQMTLEPLLGSAVRISPRRVPSCKEKLLWRYQAPVGSILRGRTDARLDVMCLDDELYQLG